MTVPCDDSNDSNHLHANTDEEIQSCFAAYKVLRPHIAQDGFLPQVRRQQAEGFQILALTHQGIVKSAAGFRFAEFLAWGKVLYIDDLITLPSEKKQGFAGQLLDWLIAHAQERQCDGVHLDTGYGRHDAHRLYLRKGFRLDCHHMNLTLSNA